MRRINKKALAKMILLITTVLAIAACNNNKSVTTMTTENKTASLFPKGEKLPAEWFSGNAFLQPLLPKDKNNDFAMGSVTFEPGARTHWHTHPRGQVLIVTEGEGIYQEKGKTEQIIRKGDVINISENVEHWHGATDHSGMVHIAITNYKGEQNVTWLAPVSDGDYQKANKS
jgi:quercetin dioxygenase-like cupin family protein